MSHTELELKFFLNLRKKPDGVSSADMIAAAPEHFAWMRERHDRGEVVMSGPSADLRHGIYLIRARSQEEAERIAADDPFTVRGLGVPEVIRWDIHQIMGVGLFEPPAIPGVNA